MARSFSQRRHVRVSRKGKVFSAGKGRMVRAQKAFDRAFAKVPRKLTKPLHFRPGGRAATARDKLVKIYQLREGLKQPHGQLYSRATTYIQSKKGSLVQRAVAYKRTLSYWKRGR